MKRAREQYYYISVNSEDRVSGTENKYTVKLPRLLQNVIQIELLSAEIPNTLYPSGIKHLYFGVHVKEDSGDQLRGCFFLCRSVLPEGVYNHDDAAAELTRSIDVFKTYLPDETMPIRNEDDPNDPNNQVLIIDRQTLDIHENPDSSDSEDERRDRERIIREDLVQEGFGPEILEENARSDAGIDPMAPFPDRQSELSYIDPDTIPFGLYNYPCQFVKANMRFKYDGRLGKFFAVLKHENLDNIVIEEARTTREFGFDTHRMVSTPYGNDGENAYYASSIAQLRSSSHIWMTIEELSSMPYWNVVSTNTHLPRNVFARIQMATDILHWVFWSQGVEEFKRECAFGQTTSLSQLTIGWLDSHGDVVDFHGIDHSLVLRVTQSPPD